MMNIDVCNYLFEKVKIVEKNRGKLNYFLFESKKSVQKFRIKNIKLYFI